MDIVIEKKYLQEAKELHREYPVVDAHLDLAGEILFRHRNGEKEILKKYYLESFRNAGIRLVVCSIFVETRELASGGIYPVLEQVSALLQDMESVSEQFVIIKQKTDLVKLSQQDKIGLLLFMEGLDVIRKRSSLLYALREMGIRGASLTWSRANALANGCCKAGESMQISGGLTPHGRRTVEHMEKLGLVLDISHLNDDGIAEIERIATRPYLATHSNLRSVHGNYRNLTDMQLQRLAGHGGVAGINACAYLVGARRHQNSIEMLCKHIEKMVCLAGAGHTELIKLSAALLQRGMHKADVINIIGGNFFRYFFEMLP